MKKACYIINKIINIITNIILILLLVIWIYYIFQVHINKVKKEEVFNYTLFLVNTGSMEDTININDVIIVKRTKDVDKNDIIAFKQDNGLIVHRIIQKNQDEIITKGDANNQADEPIKYEQIIGKVKKIIPLKVIILVIVLIFSFNIIITLLEKYISKNTNKKERQKQNNE